MGLSCIWHSAMKYSPNRGVCGQAGPSFPFPSPVIPFFFSRPNFSRRTRAETLATQASYPTASLPASQCTLPPSLRKNWESFPDFFLRVGDFCTQATARPVKQTKTLSLSHLEDTNERKEVHKERLLSGMTRRTCKKYIT